MYENTVKIGNGGRVVIPARLRKEMGLSEGDDLVIRLVKGRLEMLTPQQAVIKAQKLVRKYVPSGRKLADELISERREEALRD